MAAIMRNDPATLCGEAYGLYAGRLRRACLRFTRGNAEDADDLVHEAFAQYLRRLPLMAEPPENPFGYLLVIARRIHTRRLETSRREIADELVGEAQGGDSEEEALVRLELDAVGRAAARLCGRHRQAIALAAEGRSSAEIGQVLGICENATNQLLFRARNRLRAELGVA